jgi:sialate O-acetylesterase
MKPSGFSAILFLIAILAFTPNPLHGEVKLASLFSDHMVLQRRAPIAIFGTAAPGESVAVTLAQATKQTTAGPDGRWLLRMDAMEAGGPYAMAVVGHNFLIVKDIYIGEVWLGSGQSNMDMTVAAEDRYWCGVNNEEAEVAAVNYPQIRMFKVKLKMSDTAADDAAGQWQVTTPETVKKYSATGYFFARELWRTYHVPVGIIDSSFGASTAQAWISPEAMRSHSEFAYMLDGYAKAKADWAPAAAEEIEKHRIAMNAWAPIAAEALSEGKFEPRGPGLADPGQNQHNPSVLFNGMIAPLIPYTMRGVIWYQGESNEDAKSQPVYRLLMETLIDDWRARWGEGEFPFLYVQLASQFQLALDPNQQGVIAATREAQLQNLSVPHTGMAVTIDIGDAGNVHPKDKQDVGVRLGLLARHIAYGEAVEDSGPVADKIVVEGNAIRVHFTHIDGGFVFRGGKTPIGFAIAGADKKFVWADAKVDGDSIVLTSAAVTAPVAVRYGWADNPPVNLYNKANLPASPFRSDSW